MYMHVCTYRSCVLAQKTFLTQLCVYVQYRYILHNNTYRVYYSKKRENGDDDDDEQHKERRRDRKIILAYNI